MVWRSDAPQGGESAKVKLDLVPYMHGVVLDLGCGPEKIFKAPNIIGIDDDRDAKLFGIKSNPDIRADCSHRLPFVDEYADTIFSSHLLEHIADYQSALRDWWRVLKKDGHLILYLPDEDTYPTIGMPGSNVDHRWDVNYAKVVEAMMHVGSWDLIEFEKRDQGNEYSLLFIFRKLADA
jgi:predicted SAM-dependent methyltransferase